MNAKNTTTAAPIAPTHVAYQVKNREGQKAIWSRIGGAWPHADGQGFNIQLDAVPIDGRVTLRIPSEKDEWSADRRGGYGSPPLAAARNFMLEIGNNLVTALPISPQRE